MKQHLLRVERPVVEFERLIAAVRHQGDRVGWLELAPRAPEISGPLAAAADLGVLRAVAIGGGRSIAVKPMRGAPVLRDVLREHFRGCRLVLVAGEVEAPLLESRGEDWAVGGSRWTTQRLVAALRKPRPWAEKLSNKS